MPNKKDDDQDLSDWGKWANYVLAELKRMNGSIEDLRKDLTNITIEVVKLKVKSSIWGALAGAITVISILFIDYLRDKMSNPQIFPQYPPYSHSQSTNSQTQTQPTLPPTNIQPQFPIQSQQIPTKNP